jgi:hypothetical protein
MRRALIAAGVLLMAYAIIGALLDPDVAVIGVVIFLAAVLVVHDGVVMPAAIGLGALINRWVPEPDRTTVRLASLCSLAVTFVAIPLTLGYADLPLIRLLAVPAVVWATAAATIAGRRIRKHVQRSAGGT